MFQAISDYITAIRYSLTYGWWKHFLLPGIIAMILALIFLVAAWYLGDNLGFFLLGLLPFDLGGVAQWVGRILAILVIVLIFKHVLLAVLSPFLSILSERVEHTLYTGSENPRPESPFQRMISDLGRGLRIGIRNLGLELIYIGLFTILGFLGPMAFISSIMIFLIQAYYAGFGNFDFTLERHFRYRESIRFVKRHRFLAIGNGIIFLLLISTFIGIFVAPALSTIAGTISIHRKLHSENSTTISQ